MKTKDIQASGGQIFRSKHILTESTPIHWTQWTIICPLIANNALLSFVRLPSSKLTTSCRHYHFSLRLDLSAETTLVRIYFPQQTVLLGLKITFSNNKCVTASSLTNLYSVKYCKENHGARTVATCPAGHVITGECTIYPEFECELEEANGGRSPALSYFYRPQTKFEAR